MKANKESIKRLRNKFSYLAMGAMSGIGGDLCQFAPTRQAICQPRFPQTTIKGRISALQTLGAANHHARARPKPDSRRKLWSLSVNIILSCVDRCTYWCTHWCTHRCICPANTVQQVPRRTTQGDVQRKQADPTSALGHVTQRGWRCFLNGSSLTQPSEPI